MYHRLGRFPLPVIMSMLPLRSHHHAKFLYNDVPGRVVPEAMRKRMKDVGVSEGTACSKQATPCFWHQRCQAYLSFGTTTSPINSNWLISAVTGEKISVLTPLLRRRLACSTHRSADP